MSVAYQIPNGQCCVIYNICPNTPDSNFLHENMPYGAGCNIYMCALLILGFVEYCSNAWNESVTANRLQATDWTSQSIFGLETITGTICSFIQQGPVSFMLLLYITLCYLYE